MRKITAMTTPAKALGTSFGAGAAALPCALMKLRDTDMRAAPLVLWAALSKIMLQQVNSKRQPRL